MTVLQFLVMIFQKDSEEFRVDEDERKNLYIKIRKRISKEREREEKSSWK